MNAAARRVAVGIEYDGSAYAGWQAQAGLRTVQREVERALAAVAAEPVAVVAAGRTDAGVHALAQVAHFDTTADRPMRGWVLGANSQLPADIALHWAVAVADGFHARHSALARTYRYLLLCCRTRPALLRERVCHVRRELDASRMDAAAQVLLGEHDFSAFRGADCQSRTPQRRIDAIAVRARGPLLTLEVTANAYLHHMVRNIAGALLAIGSGERPPEWLPELLAGRDRRRGGITAPAAGLYLAAVRYPDQWQLPGMAGAGPSAMIAALARGSTP